MNVRALTLSIVIAATCAVVAIAQQSTSQQTSTSTQTTKQGSATSSASATASASASGSQQASGGASASQRSALLKPTHAIFWSPGERYATDKSIDQQEGHAEMMRYMMQLATAGKLIMVGPWRDEPGGMLLIQVKSDEEAAKIAQEAPMVKSGVFTAEVKAWNVMMIGGGAGAQGGR